VARDEANISLLFTLTVNRALIHTYIYIVGCIYVERLSGEEQRASGIAAESTTLCV